MTSLELDVAATVRERSVYFPGADALVLADLHVGRDHASPVSFPLDERADLLERLDALLTAFSPEQVVLAGDVLHSFEDVPARVRDTVAEIASACRDAGARPLLVAGNHDALLGSIWDGPVHDAVSLPDRILVCHGHESPDVDAEPGAGSPHIDPELYVVGHDHPTIRIEGRRRPCFLYGSGVYRETDVLMLPAFTRLASGVVINEMRARDFDSPLIEDADALRPIVYDPDAGEAFRFPPLGDVRRFL